MWVWLFLMAWYALFSIATLETEVIITKVKDCQIAGSSRYQLTREALKAFTPEAAIGEPVTQCVCKLNTARAVTWSTRTVCFKWLRLKLPYHLPLVVGATNLEASPWSPWWRKNYSNTGLHSLNSQSALSKFSFNFFFSEGLRYIWYKKYT